MLDILFAVVIEAFVASGLSGPGGPGSRQQRREELERRRRIRRLTMWWWMKGRRGPLPDWGYRCETCEYPLAGLKEPRCPECGEVFIPERAIDR